MNEDAELSEIASAYERRVLNAFTAAAESGDVTAFANEAANLADEMHFQDPAIQSLLGRRAHWERAAREMGGLAVSRSDKDAVIVAFQLGLMLGRLVEEIAASGFTGRAVKSRVARRSGGRTRGAKERRRVGEEADAAAIVWRKHYAASGKLSRADALTAAEVGKSEKTISDWRKLRGWEGEAC